MNKNRRKRIADLRERIDIIKNELEEVMEEEQDARDNLPNNLQDSEKAEKMDDTIAVSYTHLTLPTTSRV